MADTKMKLYYFNEKGRAELARLILAYAGKEYEDIRYEIEDWPKYKPKFPIGQCPILEVNGAMMPESWAISTFLAREFGIYASSNCEQYTIDLVCQVVEDIMKFALKIYKLPQGPERDSEIKKAHEGTFPYLAYLEKLLANNGTGYFVGSSVTLADLAVFDAQTGFIAPYIDVSDKFPLLKQNKENVLKNKNIKEYLARRPVTTV